MSLGLIILSTFSGMIAATSLYLGGQLGFVGSIGAYAATGLLMIVLVTASLLLEAQKPQL
jgi:hypothetical protein